MHYGLDIWAPIGTPVRAVESGVVLAASENGARGFGGYGHAVLLKHDSGQFSLYAHLNERAPVSPGDRVSEGQLIGHVGNSDGRAGNPTRTSPPHLHFEIRERVRGYIPGEYGEGNVNPREWLAARGVTIENGKFRERVVAPTSTPELEALRRAVASIPYPRTVRAPRAPSRGLSGAGIGLLAGCAGAAVFVLTRKGAS